MNGNVKEGNESVWVIMTPKILDHKLSCDVCLHRIVLTLPSCHSREKDPSWKHPNTLLYDVCVHRIVLTWQSSHSREKAPHGSIPTSYSGMSVTTE